MLVRWCQRLKLESFKLLKCCHFFTQNNMKDGFLKLDASSWRHLDPTKLSYEFRSNGNIINIDKRIYYLISWWLHFVFVWHVFSRKFLRTCIQYIIVYIHTISQLHPCPNPYEFETVLYPHIYILVKFFIVFMIMVQTFLISIQPLFVDLLIS